MSVSIVCPSCGAELPALKAACKACGWKTEKEEALKVLNEIDRQEVKENIRDWEPNMAEKKRKAMKDPEIEVMIDGKPPTEEQMKRIVDAVTETVRGAIHKEMSKQEVIDTIENIVKEYNENRGRVDLRLDVEDRSVEAMKEKFKEHNAAQRIRENTMTKGLQKKLNKQILTLHNTSNMRYLPMNPAAVENILVKLVNVATVQEERVQVLEIHALERSLTERIINFFRR